MNRKADTRIIVLGSGQDAGVPQIGCLCPACRNARRRVRSRRYGPSLGVIDRDLRFCFLIDASPDIKHQIDAVQTIVGTTSRRGKLPVDGILLTHAHLGHYAGLAQLGKEAIDEKGLPVYCTAAMQAFLRRTYPFNLMVKRGNIVIKRIQAGKPFRLGTLEWTAVSVPHRNEVADTVGFIIKGHKRLCYIPDLDRWDRELVRVVAGTDIALLDGTFFSKDELPRFEQVPHPPITETIERFHGLRTKICFTHINHTNPVNTSRRARVYVQRRGFRIAEDGLLFCL